MITMRPIQYCSSDLQHHLTVIQSLRSELVAYKTHFGPLPKPNVNPIKKDMGVSGGTSTDKHRESAADPNRERDRDRDRDKERARHNRNHGRDRRPEKLNTINGIDSGEQDRRRGPLSFNRDGQRPNGNLGSKREEDREYKRRR